MLYHRALERLSLPFWGQEGYPGALTKKFYTPCHVLHQTGSTQVCSLAGKRR